MAFRDKPLFLLLSLVMASTHFAVCFGLTDSETLLKFKDALSNASQLANWNRNTRPCKGDALNWNGVICVNDTIWGLKLEGMGLSGNINVEILKSFPEFKTLSFMNNSFRCPFPNFKKLPSLRSIYLSNNHFSGEIPDNAFEGLLKMKKVFMANNDFKGAIPSSLAKLPKLLELRLEGNKFKGKLPYFQQKFASFNVSNNELEGPIPESLGVNGVTSFLGNHGLCGKPLERCEMTNLSSTAEPNLKKEKVSIVSLVVVTIVVAIAVVAIIGAVVILLKRQKRMPTSTNVTPQSSLNFQVGTGSRDPEQVLHASSSRRAKKSELITKLCFVRDDREKFDLPYLLRASAEILGSGCFGSSYKAALSTSSTMVVKRYKQMNNVGKEEFDEHMRRLGRLRHPNVLSLVAYYYRKEEKLLVTDYVYNGSLAAHLHGNDASLDWPTRLKIAKGIGNGLIYLYKENPTIVVAHGHLKSSNVLLDQSNQPLLTDYGLVHLINQENAQQLMVAYKSPEYLQLSRITKKTDVWSFGMVLLELLTGRIPTNFLPQGKPNEDEDLASWVSFIPQDRWMDEVFDEEMKAWKTSEGEMTKLLRIGLSCCEGDVEKRIDLKEAVEKVNELKEKDYNDEDDNFHTWQ